MLKHRYTLPIAFAAFFFTGCESTLLDYARNVGNLSCCGIIVLILDIIALVEIMGSEHTLLNKILWAIFIICIPVLSLIIYYVFARN